MRGGACGSAERSRTAARPRQNQPVTTPNTAPVGLTSRARRTGRRRTGADPARRPTGRAGNGEWPSPGSGGRRPRGGGHVDSNEWMVDQVVSDVGPFDQRIDAGFSKVVRGPDRRSGVCSVESDRQAGRGAWRGSGSGFGVVTAVGVGAARRPGVFRWARVAASGERSGRMVKVWPSGQRWGSRRVGPARLRSRPGRLIRRVRIVRATVSSAPTRTSPKVAVRRIRLWASTVHRSHAELGWKLPDGTWSSPAPSLMSRMATRRRRGDGGRRRRRRCRRPSR